MITNKSKHPPSNNHLSRLADEALFKQSFEYQCDLSIHDVEQQLQNLTYQHSKLSSIFFPRRRVVIIERINDHHATFYIQSKLGGLYTELHARGHITQDHITDQTRLSGDIKFDAVYLTVLLAGLFFLITWTLASLSRVGHLPSPFILFTLGLTNLFYFRQMFLDRNTLIKNLAETVKQRDLSSARDRLSVQNKNAVEHHPLQDDIQRQQQNNLKQR